MATDQATFVPLQEVLVDRATGRASRSWSLFFQRLVVQADGVGLILETDPVLPADDTWWISRSGVSPAMEIDFNFQIDGTTYVVPIATV